MMTSSCRCIESRQELEVCIYSFSTAPNGELHADTCANSNGNSPACAPVCFTQVTDAHKNTRHMRHMVDMAMIDAWLMAFSLLHCKPSSDQEKDLSSTSPLG